MGAKPHEPSAGHEGIHKKIGEGTRRLERKTMAKPLTPEELKRARNRLLRTILTNALGMFEESGGDRTASAFADMFCRIVGARHEGDLLTLKNSLGYTDLTWENYLNRMMFIAGEWAKLRGIFSKKELAEDVVRAVARAVPISEGLTDRKTMNDYIHRAKAYLPAMQKEFAVQLAADANLLGKGPAQIKAAIETVAVNAANYNRRHSVEISLESLTSSSSLREIDGILSNSAKYREFLSTNYTNYDLLIRSLNAQRVTAQRALGEFENRMAQIQDDAMRATDRVLRDIYGRITVEGYLADPEISSAIETGVKNKMIELRQKIEKDIDFSVFREAIRQAAKDLERYEPAAKNLRAKINQIIAREQEVRRDCRPVAKERFREEQKRPRK